MKNLYFLDNDEKNRILKLHESSTKNGYLNQIINENIISEYGGPEDAPLRTIQTGSNTTLDLNNLTLTLNKNIDFEEVGSTVFSIKAYNELRLKSGGYFKKEGDTLNYYGNWVMVDDWAGIEYPDDGQGSGGIGYSCTDNNIALNDKKYFCENYKDVQSNLNTLCKSTESPNLPDNSQNSDNSAKSEDEKKRHQTVVNNNATKVQNKIREIDPTFTSSSNVMDKETINKVMSILYSGTTKPNDQQDNAYSQGNQIITT